MKGLISLLRHIFLILAFGLAGMLAWFALVSYPYWSVLFAPTLTVFSPQNWQAAHHYRRLALARDLLGKHSPVGMSKDEVIALLGAPDQNTPQSLTYLLELTIADFMALSFRLDEHGKVVKAFIHQT